MVRRQLTDISIKFVNSSFNHSVLYKNMHLGEENVSTSQLKFPASVFIRVLLLGSYCAPTWDVVSSQAGCAVMQVASVGRTSKGR